MTRTSRLDWTRFVLLAVLAVVLAVLCLAPPIQALESRLLDQAFRMRRAWAPSQAPDIVIVGVDEETERIFWEPLSLWHRHFSDVFSGLAEGGVRGVGVDFDLPSRSYESLMPGGNAALMAGLVRLNAKAPLVLGITVDRAFGPQPIFPPYLAAVGPEGSGVTLVPSDPDGRLRRFVTHGGPRGAYVNTLAGVLAQRLGVSVQDGLVDFGYGAPLRYIPFHQVAAWHQAGNGQALKAAFENRVVLVGSVLSQEDRHPMPVDLAAWETDFGEGPGVTFHAQILRCLLGQGLIQQVPGLWLWALALGMAVGFWVLGRRILAGFVCLLGTWMALAIAVVIGLGHGWFLPPLAVAGAAAASLAARISWHAVLQARERRSLEQAFSGHVSPAILREILEGRLAPDLAGRRVSICLLFSDIRGFTTLSEGLSPEAVIALLNRYFTRMAEVVHARGGTVDKYMGDGLMAFFGAPEPLENPCLAAFQAAQDMLVALEALNQELAGEGRPLLGIGIGLNHGEAAVGYVGSPSRHQYTAIGDAVNLASRVEGLTKELGFPVLCTRSVAEQAGAGLGFVPLGEHGIRGRGSVDLFGWKPTGGDA